jgi:hypothetical protein
MTRFHQKFQIPKLSLRGQFRRVTNLENSNGLIFATHKREFYLITFHPFSQGVKLFGGSIEDALRGVHS